MLAKSPANFAESKNIVSYPYRHSAPYSSTNKGLCMDLYLVPHTFWKDIYVAVLECIVPPFLGVYLVIYLRLLKDRSNQYGRVMPHQFYTIRLPDEETLGLQSVYICLYDSITGFSYKNTENYIQFRRLSPINNIRIIKIVSSPSLTDFRRLSSIVERPSWIPNEMPFIFGTNKMTCGLAGALFLEHHDGGRLVIMMGWTREFGMAYDVIISQELQTFAEVNHLFSPKMPGTFVDLDVYRVRVDAEHPESSFHSYGLIDVDVQRTFDPYKLGKSIPRY